MQKTDKLYLDMCAALAHAQDQDDADDITDYYRPLIDDAYRQRCPPAPPPEPPKGYKLAGRAPDGSYVFSRCGSTTRKLARGDFSPDFYRRRQTHNVPKEDWAQTCERLFLDFPYDPMVDMMP
jgi:hypothetical protein